MKNRKPQKLQLSKIVISKINKQAKAYIKGGTDPISPPMTQAPNEQGICFAIK